MFLDVYGPLILTGTWETIKLAVLSLLVSLLLGLLGASSKLSRNVACKAVATAYTTLIRGVPDLVLMLLIFFSMQIGLNHITDALGADIINIDPFEAGLLPLGFIYGAYFAEPFRGEIGRAHV